jgi:hypothetical protein
MTRKSYLNLVAGHVRPLQQLQHGAVSISLLTVHLRYDTTFMVMNAKEAIWQSVKH